VHTVRSVLRNKRAFSCLFLLFEKRGRGGTFTCLFIFIADNSKQTTTGLGSFNFTPELDENGPKQRTHTHTHSIVLYTYPLYYKRFAEWIIPPAFFYGNGSKNRFIGRERNHSDCYNICRTLRLIVRWRSRHD